MTRARLIAPVDVQIKPADRAATAAAGAFDRDGREPVRTVRRSATVTIRAQVEYRERNSTSPHLGGPAKDVSGYLIVRPEDLTAVGYTPKLGDLISKIAAKDVALYVQTAEDAGHLGSSGQTLAVVYFTDRRPSAGKPTH